MRRAWRTGSYQSFVDYATCLIVTPAVRELRHRYPDAEVCTHDVAWNDVREALLEHRVDAVVARMPFPTGKLHVTVLYEEPRVLVVPLDHRLAGKESVTLDDIADEPLPQMRHSDPAWSAYWRIDPRPGVEPGHVVLATRAADRSRLVAAFRKSARAFLTAPAVPGPATRAGD